jgi:hypothetical protein
MERLMKLPVPLRRLFDYPIGDILANLPDTNSPVWDVDKNRQKSSEAQKDTRVILFTWLDNVWAPGMTPEIDEYDYASPGLIRAVHAYGDVLARHFAPGRVVKLFLAELRAGGIIPPHTDKALALHAVHRCHLPIVTSELVDFYIERVPYHMETGVAYEFDNTRFHAVRNRGENRVHLICDVMPEAIATQTESELQVGM